MRNATWAIDGVAKTCILVAADGSFSGKGDTGLPVGGHDAVIMVSDAADRSPTTEAEQARLIAKVAPILERLDALPDLDTRAPEKIIGYNEIDLSK